MVAQYYGAKEMEQLNRTIGNTILLVLISSVIVTALSVPLAAPILALLDTPPEIIDMSRIYLQIIMAGTIASAFYNIISGILRGLGDSVSPLIYLILAALINVALDLWFVMRLQWGVAGAALATIISQCVSAILCIRRLKNIEGLPPIKKKHIYPNKPILQQILQLGLPAGLTSAVYSFAIVIMQRLTNQMGTTVINANTAVIRIDGFAMMPNFTFGMATSTFIGQNLGARKMDRVHDGVKAAVKLSLIMSVILTTILLIFGKPMLRLFSNDPQVITLGYGMLSILAFGYIAMSQSQVFAGILRGAGDTMPALYISILTSVIFRVPLAYLLTSMTRSEQWPHGSPYMLNVSLLVAWVLGAVFNILWYRYGNWREKRILGIGNASENDGE